MSERQVQASVTNSIEDLLAQAQPISKLQLTAHALLKNLKIYRFNPTTALIYQENQVHKLRVHLFEFIDTGSRHFFCAIEVTTTAKKALLRYPIYSSEQFLSIHQLLHDHADCYETPDINSKQLLDESYWKQLNVYQKDDSHEIYRKIHQLMLSQLKSGLDWLASRTDQFDHILIIEVGGGDYPDLLEASIRLATAAFVDKAATGVFTDLLESNVTLSRQRLDDKLQDQVYFETANISDINDILTKYSTTSTCVFVLASGSFNHKVNCREISEKIAFVQTLFQANVNFFFAAGKTASHATAHLMHGVGFDTVRNEKINVKSIKDTGNEPIYSTVYCYRRQDFASQLAAVKRKQRDGVLDLSLKTKVTELLKGFNETEAKSIIGINLLNAIIDASTVAELHRFTNLQWAQITTDQQPIFSVNQQHDELNYSTQHYHLICSTNLSSIPFAVSQRFLSSCITGPIQTITTIADIVFPEKSTELLSLVKNLKQAILKQKKTLFYNILEEDGIFCDFNGPAEHGKVEQFYVDTTKKTLLMDDYIANEYFYRSTTQMYGRSFLSFHENIESPGFTVNLNGDTEPDNHAKDYQLIHQMIAPHLKASSIQMYQAYQELALIHYQLDQLMIHYTNVVVLGHQDHVDHFYQLMQELTHLMQKYHYPDWGQLAQQLDQQVSDRRYKP